MVSHINIPDRGPLPKSLAKWKASRVSRFIGGKMGRYIYIIFTFYTTERLREDEGSQVLIKSDFRKDVRGQSEENRPLFALRSIYDRWLVCRLSGEG